MAKSQEKEERLQPPSEWAKFRAEGLAASKSIQEISVEWKALKAKAPRLESGESRLTPPAQELSEDKVEGDYLRQYQYRKQTKFGSVDSDPQPGSKAAIMKKFLLSQPRVRMLFPRPQGEDGSVLQTVNLNGYRLDFPKDAYVDVPIPVADVLGESLKQTNAALRQFRIDGNKEKEKALQ